MQIRLIRSLFAVSIMMQFDYLIVEWKYMAPIKPRTSTITWLIIRLKRNTSNPQKTKQFISQFKTRLLSRGYSVHEIDSIVSEVEKTNRQDLLKDSKITSNRPPSVLVTKYNPAIKKLGTLLHWKIIQKDKQCSAIFPIPPIIGYKRHRNLNELINT